MAPGKILDIPGEQSTGPLKVYDLATPAHDPTFGIGYEHLGFDYAAGSLGAPTND
jgi:hypothetical protein